MNKKCPGLLTSTPQAISHAEASYDVEEFRTAVSRADWRIAANLYEGHFLETIDLPQSVEFSHWKEGVGQSLARAAEQVVAGLMMMLDWQHLDLLTQRLLGQGRVDIEVATARVTALFQSEGEAESRNFIRELPPDVQPAVTQTLERLADSGESDTQQPSQPFVGRVHHLNQLIDLYEESLQNRPQMAVITGEAGIGKTVLATRFQKILAMRGARVLVATAHTAEQNIPFGIVEQWLRDLRNRDLEQLSGNPWLAVVQRVFPDVDATNSRIPEVELGDISHHRLLESLRRLVGDLGGTKPLVLSIDDAQNADSASLGFLHYLFRKPPPVPILAIATLRNDVGASPRKFADWQPAKSIELSGLSPVEIMSWLEEVGEDRADREVAASFLHQRTGGNPLLISALLEEGAGLDEIERPPQSIIDFYRPRILSRSLAAQRLLATISLIGESESWDALGEIAGLTETESTEAVRELQELHWLVPLDASFSLKHSLLGQVAVSLLSEVERRGLHGRAARVLGGAGDLPDALVAISHDLAGNSMDAFEAATKAVEACDTLHARTEKEFFLKLALSNAPSPADEARIRIQLGEHHLKERRLKDALEILDVTQTPSVPIAIRNQIEMMRLRVMAEMTGDPETLADYWDQATVLSTGLPLPVVADTFTHIGGIAYDLGIDDLAAEAAELVLERLSKLPREIPSALQQLRPTAVVGFLRGFRGALDRLAKLPEPDGQHAVYDATYHAVNGTLLVAAADLAEAEHHFATSLEITERFALFDHLHVINNNLGVCLLEQGRYAEAEERLKEAIKYAAETSPSQYSTPHENLTILAYERSAFNVALESGKALLEAREVSGGRARMSLQAIVGLSAFELGELTRCREAERELYVLKDRYAGHSNDMSYVHMFLAKMLVSRRDHDAALNLLSGASARYEERNRLASLRLEIEKCRILANTGVDCSDQIDRIVLNLQGTGAIPLIERSTDLQIRLRRHRV